MPGSERQSQWELAGGEKRGGLPKSQAGDSSAGLRPRAQVAWKEGSEPSTGLTFSLK